MRANAQARHTKFLRKPKRSHMRVRTRAQMVIAPARLTFEIALATADLAITPNTVA